MERNKTLFRIIEINEHESFFRMRTNELNYQLSKKDLLHIPFELRNEIESKRYSIPGYPSLYLGKSVYICWEELKRPDMHRFQVSKFESKEKLFLVDLTPPNYISDPYSFKSYSYVMLWPLVVACSVKAANPSSPFKPEYIIPQLLLQWIRNNQEMKIDGIKYLSTQIELNSKEDIKNAYNVVIPVKSNKKKGYCSQLEKKFEVSDPISWLSIQMQRGGNVAWLPNNLNKTDINERLPKLNPCNTRTFNYDHSFLGLMERILEETDSKETRLVSMRFEQIKS
jgi:hypothetical protein